MKQFIYISRFSSNSSACTTTVCILFLTLFPTSQVPLYALNQKLVIEIFKAMDTGGTICIHLFGAYYGLAASIVMPRWVLCQNHHVTADAKAYDFSIFRLQNKTGMLHPKNESRYGVLLSQSSR